MSLKRTMNKFNKVRQVGQNATSQLSTFLLFRTRRTILIIVCFCVLFCFPSYLYPTVREIGDCYFINNTTKSSCYYVDQSELNKFSDNLIFQFSFYLQAIFAKIIPCFLLIIFVCLIVKLFLQIRKKKKEISQKVIKMFVFFPFEKYSN